MAFLLRSIVLLAAFPGGSILRALGENCILPTANYIVLPLGPCNITDSAGQAIQSWGSAVTFAGQAVCLEVNTVTNNLRVISSAVCESDRGNTTIPQCASQRGGLFQTDDNSTTFNDIPESELVADPGWEEWNNSGVAVHGTLDISDVALPINVGVITNGTNFTAGYLPLTNQSSLLQTLVDNNFIAERAFGIKIGTQILTNPQGGSLVIGGYDKGSLGGPLMNFSMDYPITPVGGDRECPIQVTIEQLLYQSPTLGVKLLLGNGQTVTACLEAYDTKFRFNEPILSLFREEIGLTQNFNITNSTFLRPEPGLLIPKNITFDGSFAFQLANGNESFTVTIPNEELYGPVTGIASDGSITSLTNANVSEIGVYSTPAPENTAVLGRIFLSQVYLYVNYDEKQFSIAQVGTSVDSVYIPLSSPSGCPTSGLQPSFIAAIVVGVIVFLLILALLLLLWIFYKYWKKQQAVADFRNGKEESARKEDMEIGKEVTENENEVAGKRNEAVEIGKEIVGNEKAVAGKRKESDKKMFGELAETSPGRGERKELSSEAENGTLLFNPCRPPYQLNPAAGTYYPGPHLNRYRQQSDGSVKTGSTSYDVRPDLARHQSIDTTITGSAANMGKALSELDDSQSQSPISPSVTAHGEE